MSDDTFKCILEPYKTVGAQDLLKIGYQYYGHLRKYGKREQLFSSLSFSSLSLKWRQKFVILSQGCVYCYGSEFSKSPSAAFSLSVYERVEEIGDQAQMLHCFEVYHEDHNKTPHRFACETDQKRKEWIAHIKESIEQSHNVSQGSLHSEGGGSDEGIVMAPAITKRQPTRNLPPLPSIPSDDDMVVSSNQRQRKTKKPESEYDLGDDDDDEDEEQDTTYNDVDDSTFNQPMFGSPTSRHGLAGSVGLPGMAGMNISGQRPLKPPKPGDPAGRPAVPLPLAKPKKTADTRQSYAYEDTEPTKPRVGIKPLHAKVFPPNSYLFDSSDKDQARDILSSKPDGTFLLRNGRQDPDKKVLSVKTHLGVKEFQMHQKDGQVTLNNQDKFEDVDKLLTHYRENNLPKNEYQQKLVRGFKS